MLKPPSGWSASGHVEHGHRSEGGQDQPLEERQQSCALLRMRTARSLDRERNEAGRSSASNGPPGDAHGIGPILASSGGGLGLAGRRRRSTESLRLD